MPCAPGHPSPQPSPASGRGGQFRRRARLVAAIYGAYDSGDNFVHDLVVQRLDVARRACTHAGHDVEAADIVANCDAGRIMSRDRDGERYVAGKCASRRDLRRHDAKGVDLAEPENKYRTFGGAVKRVCRYLWSAGAKG